MGNAEQQKDSPGCRDSKSSLGDMHKSGAVQKTREKERRLTGKLYPWIEEEYPAMIGHCNPALAEAMRQRDMEEIYRAQVEAR